MKFKSPEVEAEMLKTSLFLREMAQKLDAASLANASQEIIITRVKEHICGDSGVHEDNRAFDVRDEFEGGRLYDDSQVQKIMTYMNDAYPRNDAKTTCIHHSFQGGPFHFHIQLARETKTYEPKPSGS